MSAPGAAREDGIERLLDAAVEAELLVQEHRALYIAAQERAESLFRDALKAYEVPAGELDKSGFWGVWLDRVKRARDKAMQP